jgi:hypothetical protein
MVAIWRPRLAVRVRGHRGWYIGSLLILLLAIIGICLATKAMVSLKVGHFESEGGIEMEKGRFRAGHGLFVFFNIYQYAERAATWVVVR